MPDLSSKKQHHEHTWSEGYSTIPGLVRRFGLKSGVEIGVAFGGRAESILRNSNLRKLFGVDRYRHVDGYDDSMNMTDADFEKLYEATLDRLAHFGDRFELLRLPSDDAVAAVPGLVDFVYIDADHSYEGVRDDLGTWFTKVRDGGIIAGHDYGHRDFPGVKVAVDEFFRRFGWRVNAEPSTVWWVRKEPVHITFITPAYNAAATLVQSAESVMANIMSAGDEYVVVNDGSSDGTAELLKKLERKHSILRVLTHRRNHGGGAARNTALEHASNPLVFCLDSDNILPPGTVNALKGHMLSSNTDVATCGEVRYFTDDPSTPTHSWLYQAEHFSLADCFSGKPFPGASGNYLYTLDSHIRASGYPEFNFMDTWGFGFRQVVTGAKMQAVPGTYYLHRYGHESYWVRGSRGRGSTSRAVLQIILPYIELLDKSDVRYILSGRARERWFEDLRTRRVRTARVEYTPEGYRLLPGRLGRIKRWAWRAGRRLLRHPAAQQ